MSINSIQDWMLIYGDNLIYDLNFLTYNGKQNTPLSQLCTTVQLSHSYTKLLNSLTVMHNITTLLQLSTIVQLSHSYTKSKVI